MKKRLKIAVLCGGPSSEWEVSLNSGKEVMKHLPRERYDASLVHITRDGRWMLVGKKEARPLMLFGKDGRPSGGDLRKFDVAFIALHGQFGEDGTVQAILETLQVPYTGSGVFSSAAAMNKLFAQEIVARRGIPVPETMVLTRDALDEPSVLQKYLQREMGYPLVIKPNGSGSSVGVSIVESSAGLMPALKSAFQESGSVLAQEYIRGRELTCGVMGNASCGGDLMALPPVEIVSHSRFFDYEAKYKSKETEEICPAPLKKELLEEVQALAAEAHDALECDGLTRTDFMLAKGRLYFLETNTIPGLTAASLCPKEARAMGMEFGEFLSRIIDLALEKRAG